ncbi:MAG TPA: hypothetical protein EYH47_16790 [Pseudomonas oleovorans]|nr:hypothetical protein [Pseudomonas oleovorans]
MTMLSACNSAGLIRLSPWVLLRRIDCRRFGGSISPGLWALSRKNDWGIAENVKPVADRHAGFVAPLSRLPGGLRAMARSR